MIHLLEPALELGVIRSSTAAFARAGAGLGCGPRAALAPASIKALACLRIELDDSCETDKLRAVIESSVRKIDITFCVGEGGFLLLLPNTHFPGALAVAERIWKDAYIGRSLSTSVGVSFYPNRDTHSLQDLLDLVEAALKQARDDGGGKICLYQHQGYLYAPEL